MFKRMGWTESAILGLLLFWVFAGETRAQEPVDELRRQYEEELRRLEQQLRDLEERQREILERMEEAPDPELEQRVEELETELADVKGDANTFRLYWKDGIRFDTADERFQLRLNGRIQVDAGWFWLDDDLEDAGFPDPDGVEFRRARLEMRGTIYDDFFFKSQYDFTGTLGGAFRDVYMGAKLPVDFLDKVQVGHFKEPFGLEALTSSNDITFMERSSPNAFAPFRNTGVAVYGTAFEERLGYAGGVFAETDDFGFGSTDIYNVTGRVFGVPYYAEDGRRLVHLGLGGTFKDVDGNPFRVRGPREAHLFERILNTGFFPVEDLYTFDLEAAAVFGPFHIASEFFYSSISAVDSIYDGDLMGVYVQGGYFLTGEHRPYKLGGGAWGAVRPNKNFGFGPDGGPGAWEVAARYSYLDLDDGGINGGERWNVTLGLNWYLNPNMRIMLNYLHGEVDRDGVFDPIDSTDPDDFIPAVDGSVDAVLTRFQITW